MTHRFSPADLVLSTAVFVVLGALAWSLFLRPPTTPLVLAQSAAPGGCPAGSECTDGTKVESGRTYRCVNCAWEQQTDDPAVTTNDNFCCLAKDGAARCERLRTGEACRPNALEPYAKLFSTAENNQRACSTECRPLSVQSSVSSAASSSSSSTWCGNNVLEPENGEECDWGGNNSDIVPNRCRKNCTFPTCGDSQLDDNFSDPVTGMFIAEECDNVEDGNQVSETQWTWNLHETCNSNCTVKRPANPLFFMFPKALESPLYVVRKVFDWNSIFFPLSSLGF